MVNFFTQLLNISILASYLIIAVIAVRAIFRKIPRSVICILWMLVGLRLVVPQIPETHFSLLPSNQVFGESNYHENLPIIHTGYEKMDDSANAYIQDQYAIPGTKAAESMSDYQRIFLWSTVLWIAGMLVLFGYFLYSWWKIKVRVKTAIPEEINGTKVYRSDGIDASFLFGILVPKIYVPWGIDGESLGSILSHEKAHLERKDYLLKPAFYLLLILHWFNPFVWIAYILLCRDIEFACDERVMRQLGEDRKKEYSQVLLANSVKKSPLAGCPVAFGEGDVKSRIKRVLSYRKPTVWVLAGAGVVCVLVALLFMTGKKETIGENTILYGDYKICLEYASACEETQIMDLKLRICNRGKDTEAFEDFVNALLAESHNSISCEKRSDTEYVKYLSGFYKDMESALVLFLADTQSYEEVGAFPASLVELQEARSFEADSDFGKVRLTISPTTMKVEALEGHPKSRDMYAFILEMTSKERWMVGTLPLVGSHVPEYHYDKEAYTEFLVGEYVEDALRIWRYSLREEIPLEDIAGFLVESGASP